MKHLIPIVFFLFFSIPNAISQETYTLSGRVSEEASQETLIGVNVIFPKILKGTTTNGYGFYSITLPKGTYELEISYLGFETVQQKIDLHKNSKLDVNLKTASEQIDEVVLKSNSTIISLKSLK